MDAMDGMARRCADAACICSYKAGGGAAAAGARCGETGGR